MSSMDPNTTFQQKACLMTGMKEMLPVKQLTGLEHLEILLLFIPMKNLILLCKFKKFIMLIVPN